MSHDLSSRWVSHRHVPWMPGLLQVDELSTEIFSHGEHHPPQRSSYSMNLLFRGVSSPVESFYTLPSSSVVRIDDSSLQIENFVITMANLGFFTYSPLN